MEPHRYGNRRMAAAASVGEQGPYSSRVLHWLVCSALLVGTGLAISWGGMPMNKQLWTTSYACFMARVRGVGRGRSWLDRAD